MPSLSKLNLPKLKGSNDYNFWAIRMQAILTNEKLLQPILQEGHTKNEEALALIYLSIEDGPLSQIQHIKSAKEAWDKLQSLYKPVSFTSNFLLIKDLFNTQFTSYNSIEEYLNRIKEIYNDLESRDIKIPEIVVIAWILNSLDESFSSYITNITQALRNDSEAYNLESLTSSLIDEAKRTQDINPQAFLIKKKQWKKERIVKKCSHCKLKGHLEKDCYFLHLEKAPKSFKINTNNRVNKRQQQQQQPKKEVKIPDEGKNKEKNNPFLLALNQGNSPHLYDDKMDYEGYAETVPSSPEVILLSLDTSMPYKDPYINNLLGPLTRNIPRIKNLLLKVGNNKGTLDSNNQGYYSFIYDTGATRHITSDIRLLRNYRSIETSVNWGNASYISVKGKGDIIFSFLDNKGKLYILKDCLFIPRLGVNIISQSYLKHTNAYITDTTFLLLDSKGNTLVRGENNKGLYTIPVFIPSRYKPYTNKLPYILNIKEDLNKDTKVDIYKWHLRLGHINYKALYKMLKKYYKNLSITKEDIIKIKYCDICLKAKSTNKINKQSSKRVYSYLEKVAIDIWGPIKTSTYNKYTYFISFLDKGTRYLDIALLKSKGEAYNKFLEYKARVENNPDKIKIREIFSDNAKEFIYTIKPYCLKNGIIYNTSPPNTPYSNGFIERINRTLLNKVRALLFTAGLPKYLWGEALYTAVYLYNRTPHSKIGFISPLEKRDKITIPLEDLEKIKTFGSTIYYKNKDPSDKLETRAYKGVIIGYLGNAYKIWDFSRRKIIISRDITILENTFIGEENTIDFNNLPSLNKIPSNYTSKYPTRYNTNKSSSNNNNTSNSTRDNTSKNTSNNNTRDISSNNNNTSSNNREQEEVNKGRIRIDIPKKPTEFYKDFEEYPANNTINTILNSENKEVLLYLLENKDPIEPTTYKQALNSPEAIKWQEGMQIEVSELLKQNTWEITRAPKDREALGGRWVYRLKKDNKNNILKYKARWVVQGFRQIKNLDYIDTFSTTARPESIRLLLLIAVSNNFSILQYDIKNAFVHADIDTDIYTQLPLGLEEYILKDIYYKSRDNISMPYKQWVEAYNKGTLIAKLRKALYGLKQSPKLWYNYLAKVLAKIGFYPLPIDEGVFINREERIAIAIHVDDLLVIGPIEGIITSLLAKIDKDLKIQPLGEVKDFLGMYIDINRAKKSITISQEKYTLNKLREYNKQDIGVANIPAKVGVKLKKATNTPSKDDILRYQKEVGSLLYLALYSRPDILYPIISCARFASKPDKSHFIALDDIWKYLNKYPRLALVLNCDIPFLYNFIKGYSDASWASDLTERKSFSGYCFYIYNSLISWACCKQKTISLSSCEAEFVGLREANKEALYLNRLYTIFNKYLSIRIPDTIPPILTDNQAAIKLAENPEFHKKTKHIDLAYFFTRENMRQKKIRIFYIKSEDNIADIFTKELGAEKFNKFRALLSLQ